jgi:hypothetical protein
MMIGIFTAYDININAHIVESDTSTTQAEKHIFNRKLRHKDPC